MSAKHTPGPWTLTPDWSRIGGDDAVLIAGKDGVRVLDQYAYEGMHMEEANAARIVACVNACEGMDDPAAEIARLREDNAKMLEIQAMLNEQALELSTERWNAQADLREALDALDAILEQIDRRNLTGKMSDQQGRVVQRKHGRAV